MKKIFKNARLKLACWVAAALNDRRKYLQISKKKQKKLASQLKSFKNLIFGGFPGGGTPELCPSICLSNIYWYTKTGTMR